MAKITLNLPNVINWWHNILDNVDIPAMHQLTMFHIICRLNRNFWRPAQISTKKLSCVMNCDVRTVNAALKALMASGFIVLTKEGVNINVNGNCSNFDPCDVSTVIGARICSDASNGRSADDCDNVQAVI